MKVLPIIDTLRVGGPGKGLISLIVSLRETVEFPGVVTFNSRGEEVSDFSRALHEAAIPEIPLLASRAGPRAHLRALRNLVHDLAPDIVQTHGYKANFLVAVEALRRGATRDWRWVSWVHGYTAENVKILLYNKLEHWSAPRSDLTIFVSRSLKDAVRSEPRDWTVVPNGIDSTYAEVNPEDIRAVERQLGAEREKIILVVGRYSHEKGQDRIPRIAAELAVRRDDFRFVLIGEGPQEQHLRSLIAREGVEERVQLRPFVTDIRPYYRAATMCVLPSRREGMPNVVLEALLMGCPLVSVEVGGVTEIVTPGIEALIVPQNDDDALINAIESMLKSETVRSDLARAGKNRIQASFLSVTRAQRVEELYRRLLLAGTAPPGQTSPSRTIQ